jgi:ribose transport system substrate-binding protein
MNTVLQAHPDLNVIIGDDTVVAEALAAAKAAGKLHDKMYFGGVGGSDQAWQFIKDGLPYRSSLPTAWETTGYATGMWACDYIEGKPIPGVAELLFTNLNSGAAIDTFKADEANPDHTIRTKMGTYLGAYGSISYAQRRNYWNSSSPSADLTASRGGG